jgi:hypothetical protein
MKLNQAMGELATLMVHQQLNADTFARWVRRYYGEPRDQSSLGLVQLVARHHTEPHPLDTLRMLEFDKFLRELDGAESSFIEAMVELRNVFARNANLAVSATVSLSAPLPPPVPSEPPTQLPEAEALGELLGSEDVDLDLDIEVEPEPAHA